jgi:hypothetical protein
MTRNKNNLAIVRMLIGIAVLTFVCGSTESSPPPAPAPLNTDAISANDQADVTTTPLPQTITEAPRVSITFNDDSSSSFERLNRLPPTPKPSGGPDLDVWYGDYFTDNKLPRLSASPVESEPNRLGVKLSFSF